MSCWTGIPSSSFDPDQEGTVDVCFDYDNQPCQLITRLKLMGGGFLPI
jgi:hypothetical protein